MAKPGDPLKETSFQFSIRIVNVYKHLLAEYGEYVLSEQLLRSGTSIGANIAEAKQSQSDLDFVSKLSIALKEAVESIYWLELLAATNYLTEAQTDSLIFRLQRAQSYADSVDQDKEKDDSIENDNETRDILAPRRFCFPFAVLNSQFSIIL